ncbi:MAG: acetyl-CoA carboxylase, biotin carboxyl carrier protein [Candidatus Marinimicrobia bacterium]|nr:acetyl-CoA carboxylase, biotin carboxyl carrier protein [Candidatus Neomarinimicrobiota bacterium]
MWQDKLKEIIYILENSNVNEIEVNFWGRKYRVTKSPGISTVASSNAVSAPAISTPTTSEVIDDASTLESNSEVVSKGEELLSPMPGTYYSSPTPDDPPFISVGDSVKKGQILCIVEAMKIMNEIEAETDGIVTKVFMDNGEPVEYNQSLFLIDPA